MILTGKCDFSEFTPASTDLFYNPWPGCSSGAAAGGDGGSGRFPLELCWDGGEEKENELTALGVWEESWDPHPPWQGWRRGQVPAKSCTTGNPKQRSGSDGSLFFWPPAPFHLTLLQEIPGFCSAQPGAAVLEQLLTCGRSSREPGSAWGSRALRDFWCRHFHGSRSAHPCGTSTKHGAASEPQTPGKDRSWGDARGVKTGRDGGKGSGGLWQKNCRGWRRTRGSVGFRDSLPSPWGFGDISLFILGFKDISLFTLGVWVKFFLHPGVRGYFSVHPGVQGCFSLHPRDFRIFIPTSWDSGMLSFHPGVLRIILPSSWGSGMLSLLLCCA